MTEFQVQKLISVGNRSGLAPYQITPVNGVVLGTIGQIMHAADSREVSSADSSHKRLLSFTA